MKPDFIFFHEYETHPYMFFYIKNVIILYIVENSKVIKMVVMKKKIVALIIIINIFICLNITNANDKLFFGIKTTPSVSMPIDTSSSAENEIYFTSQF